MRRDVIDMLFVEGNHFCMFCEKSGNCELQALAYRFGITAPKYPFAFPQRELDASHPEIFIDRNRCILCGRCVRASRSSTASTSSGSSDAAPDQAGRRQRLRSCSAEPTPPPPTGRRGLPDRIPAGQAGRLRRTRRQEEVRPRADRLRDRASDAEAREE